MVKQRKWDTSCAVVCLRPATHRGPAPQRTVVPPRPPAGGKSKKWGNGREAGMRKRWKKRQQSAAVCARRRGDRPLHPRTAIRSTARGGGGLGARTPHGPLAVAHAPRSRPCSWWARRECLGGGASGRRNTQLSPPRGAVKPPRRAAPRPCHTWAHTGAHSLDATRPLICLPFRQRSVAARL